MGNSDSQSHGNNHKITFEESKKEYFSHVRKNMKNNIKEIVSTLSKSNKSISTLNNNDESDDNNVWQSFLISKLKIYKERMNQDTTIYVDNVIGYVDKLIDTNDNQVHKLKVFLSNEIEETRNIRSNSSKEVTTSLFSPSKNEIILRSIDFIFNDLDTIDHPLNKVIKLINFNFTTKYQKELNQLERMEENTNNKTNFEEKFGGDKSPQKSRKSTSSSQSFNFEKNKIKDLKNDPIKISIEDVNKFYLYIKEEISNLSIILILTIIKFYNIIEEPEYRIIDIMEEKVKDLLISGDILKFLQRLKYNSKKDIIEKYQEKFLEYYNILPRDLGISPYFSFDTDFKSKIKESLTKNTEIIIPIVKNISNLPFSKSLIYFREINRTDSIIKKLEIMYNLRDVILSEIDEFWQEYPIQQKKRYIDADNLLSIFIYLVIKSQLADLIVDIEIIEDFINKSLKLSRKGIFLLYLGYFFSLVQSSFEYLLNTMSISQLEINLNEYKYTLDNELSSLENKTESIIDMTLINKDAELI